MCFITKQWHEPRYGWWPCNFAKCTDQEISSCAPNFSFFDNSLTTFVHDVAGGTELLSMIGVLCSYQPANSLVKWCVSEMAVP